MCVQGLSKHRNEVMAEEAAARVSIEDFDFGGKSGKSVGEQMLHKQASPATPYSRTVRANKPMFAEVEERNDLDITSRGEMTAVPVSSVLSGGLEGDSRP